MNKHWDEIIEPATPVSPGVARLEANRLEPGVHQIDSMDISSISIHGKNVVVELVVTEQIKKNMGWLAPSGTKYYSKHELVTVTLAS